MIGAASLLLPTVLAAGPSLAPGVDDGTDSPARLIDDGHRHRMDAPLPPRPPVLTTAPRAAARDLGTPTTLFVNFDGVELGSCNPSDSKRDCHWYNNDEPIPPFSGSLQTRVSVLQAMRRDAADYGVRITGQRPPSSEDYTMVIYGGVEEDYGALGSAPSGDCDDQLPNQIAFAHVDGELNTWVNGGATTALHEAAHSWGLDHIETDGAIMFPSGNNEPTTFDAACSVVVDDVNLNPGAASCPEINSALCSDANAQQGAATLSRLFGGPYIDMQPPTIELLEPADGQYFQAPANFEVTWEVRDDLHPQAYDTAFWLNDDPKPESRPFIEDHFSVSDLPIGTWEFHVEVIDEAGHPAQLDFTIEVGEDPPPDPPAEEGGCAVGAVPRGGVRGLLGLVIVVLPVVARRRRSG
ncbi:MAG: hypothetical protein K0V04_00240 [Deltaproteobacteria bacterium]|nr:hypothetical protein [Deltaproteobacteria bacterium]